MRRLACIGNLPAPSWIDLLVSLSTASMLMLGAHSASAQSTYSYAGEVTVATDTLAVLTPPGTTLEGEVDLISPGPGGTTSDPAALTRALLHLGAFCLNLNDVCTSGSEMEIVQVDMVSITFDDSNFPVSGIIEAIAFSQVFQIEFPITLNVTDGTFVMENALGIASGPGNFDRTEIPSIELLQGGEVLMDGDEVTFTPAPIGILPNPIIDITAVSVGNVNLDISDIFVEGDADFTVTSNCATLPPLISCTAIVEFAPTQPVGTKTATLTFLSNDPYRPAASLVLRGAATAQIEVLSRASGLFFDGSDFGDTDVSITSADLSAPFDATLSATLAYLAPGGFSNQGGYSNQQYDSVSATVLQVDAATACDLTVAEGNPVMRLQHAYEVEFTVSASTQFVLDGTLTASSNISDDPYAITRLYIASQPGAPDLFSSANNSFPHIGSVGGRHLSTGSGGAYHV